jgi:hypothetical protein
MNRIVATFVKAGPVAVAASAVVIIGAGTASANVTYENAAATNKSYNTSTSGYLKLNGTANGSKVVEYHWTTSVPGEEWSYLNGSGASGSVHQLKSVNAGNCMDDVGTGGGKAGGTDPWQGNVVTVWTCGSATSQKWIDYNMGTYGDHTAWQVFNTSSGWYLTATTNAIGTASDNVLIDDQFGMNWATQYWY